MPNFSGIWTVTQQMQAKGASTWPATPGAPTIGTATAGNSNCASVTFTAPACTGYPSGGITGYRVTSTPGCFTNTGASSPIVVSGLTNGTSYTFKAAATNTIGYGPCSAASNSITASSGGSQSYTTPGTYSWIAPSGVTSVSVVAIGAGGNGSTGYYYCCCAFYPSPGAGGGGLGYKNNYAVTPGNSYTIFVGNYVTYNNGVGQNSYFVSTAVLKGGGGSGGSIYPGYGGDYVGDGGGNGGYGGGNPGVVYAGGGGGAGGYSGTGGLGGAGGNGSAGSGGGGGGGAGATAPGASTKAYGGGGTGLLGQGTSGGSSSGGGIGGSGGTNGVQAVASTSTGGLYGGGGPSSNVSTYGGSGAVRIIWPGTSRSFPSTNAGNP